MIWKMLKDPVSLRVVRGLALDARNHGTPKCAGCGSLNLAQHYLCYWSWQCYTCGKVQVLRTVECEYCEHRIDCLTIDTAEEVAFDTRDDARGGVASSDSLPESKRFSSILSLLRLAGRLFGGRTLSEK